MSALPAKLSVSVSARVYARLRDHSERTGLSMAQIIAALTDSLEPLSLIHI